MAVSNAFGSNTFNILIGLGLPWLVYILAATGNVSAQHTHAHVHMKLVHRNTPIYR